MASTSGSGKLAASPIRRNSSSVSLNGLPLNSGFVNSFHRRYSLHAGVEAVPFLDLPAVEV
jgi:hypothetical protein